jgi:hypothetical protein
MEKKGEKEEDNPSLKQGRWGLKDATYNQGLSLPFSDNNNPTAKNNLRVLGYQDPNHNRTASQPSPFVPFIVRNLSGEVVTSDYD